MKPTSNLDIRAYRVGDAGKAYGLSRTTLYKLMAEGRLQVGASRSPSPHPARLA